MPSPNPPSELPAVQAEVVETKKPEPPKRPDLWLCVAHDVAGWRAWVDPQRAVVQMSVDARGKYDEALLVCIPGEQAPSSPTHAGEMPGWLRVLIESTQIRADTFRSNGLGKWAGQLEDCIAKAKAHYAHPQPTGMTREVEELVKYLDECRYMKQCQGCTSRLEAVRAAGGGA